MCITTEKPEYSHWDPSADLLISMHLLENNSLLRLFCGNRGRYSTYLDSYYKFIPATFLGLLGFSSLIFEQSAVFSKHGCAEYGIYRTGSAVDTPTYRTTNAIVVQYCTEGFAL